MNKHGFTRVLKRSDERAKPYYARRKIAGETFYTTSFATSSEAAAAADKPIHRHRLFPVCTCGRDPWPDR